jgi:hypothetical protein
VHNLESLAELVDALNAPAPRRMDGLVAWQARARAA